MNAYHKHVHSQTLGTYKHKYEYAGISMDEFSALAIYGKQRNYNWCWAACIQMVLNYHHILLTQEEIVKKSLGSLVDKPANPELMFKILNGQEINRYGKVVKLNCNIFPTTSKEISSFLNTNKPLIVGVGQKQGIGHAYVLIGMYYDIINYDSGVKKYNPYSVVLVDPWPGNPSTSEMNWSEFSKKVMVCYKIWIN